MGRRSLEAEEVVAHADVRVGTLHPYPAFGAQSHSVTSWFPTHVCSILCSPHVDRPLTIALGKDCKHSNKLLHAYPQMSINLCEGGGTHTPLSAHCSGPGAAFGLAPSYSRAITRSRWSSRRLRTDVRLLQAAFREPFLLDEMDAQDQARKCFLGVPFPKTLHREYSHREGCSGSGCSGVFCTGSARCRFWTDL